MPTSKSKNKPVGICLGDPCGIGPEVAAKALRKFSARQAECFVIIGDNALFKKYFPRSCPNCEFVDTHPANQNKRPMGKVSLASGKAALSYLDQAVGLIKNKKIRALVTAPVCKESICLTKKSFQGHTEYLAEAFGVKNPGMMFVSDKLKTIIVTRHMAVKNVSRSLTAKIIYETIALTHQALKNLFHVTNPRIAVCGLNPHASERGKFGREEEQKIIPAIKRAKKNRIKAEGPFAADTLFIPHIAKKFDVIVAMYHDQGLTPVKSMYFNKLVNLTIGLPFIRTSPAHGTAFNIAGKNKANPQSMSEAIKLAVRLSK